MSKKWGPPQYPASVPCKFLSDAGRIRQVLTNLVGNAVKFTLQGRVLISVECERQEDTQASMTITVSDTGVGIPEEKLDCLFRKFSQADTSVTRRYGGTGLGLAISKQLIELMSGSIDVQSVPEQGSTFRVRVPLRFDGHPYAAAVPVAELQGLRVLIVDDDDVNRRVVHEQISSLGMRNGSYASGHDALEAMRVALAAGDPFRIVIADYNMPGLDGAAMAARIKADPKLREAVILMLTSVGSWRGLRHLEGSAVDACLVKPVRQSQLTNALLQAWSHGTSAPKPVEAPTRDRKPAVNGTVANLPSRVLVAEDNIVNQKVISRMLEKLGIRCDVAANGREAVEMLELLPYDLVFMDCQMPEMNGHEAILEIRRRESGSRRVTIIAMTAQATVESREDCMKSGMDGFLSKPVIIEELIKVLNWSRAIGCELPIPAP